MEGGRLLVQEDMDALSELVDASTLPVFNSDRAAGFHESTAGRVTVPLADEAAHITYYLACLNEKKERELLRSLPL